MTRRQGFESVRTGFSYRQLVQWTGQAWLRLHFGADYDAFFRETGITTREEFKEVVATYAGPTALGTPPRGPESAVAQLITRDDSPTRAKVLAVYALAASYEPHVTSGLVPSP